MNIKPPLPPILPSADVLRYSLIDAASNFKSVRAGNCAWRPGKLRKSIPREKTVAQHTKVCSRDIRLHRHFLIYSIILAKLGHMFPVIYLFSKYNAFKKRCGVRFLFPNHVFLDNAETDAVFRRGRRDARSYTESWRHVGGLSVTSRVFTAPTDFVRSSASSAVLRP